MVFTGSIYTILRPKRPLRSSTRLQYQSPRNGFDIMIAASEWAVAFWLTTSPSASAGSNRILLLEVGSVIYPTDAYIMCRITNVSRESASRPANGRREVDVELCISYSASRRKAALVRAQHQYVPGSEFAIRPYQPDRPTIQRPWASRGVDA